MLFILSEVIVYYYYWYFVDSWDKVEVSHLKLSATHIFHHVRCVHSELNTFIKRTDDIQWTFECKYNNEYFKNTTWNTKAHFSAWSNNHFWAAGSHSDTPQSVVLLWTSDQPDAETST